jgi:hypothetical protein
MANEREFINEGQDSNIRDYDEKSNKKRRIFYA